MDLENEQSWDPSLNKKLIEYADWQFLTTSCLHMLVGLIVLCLVTCYYKRKEPFLIVVPICFFAYGFF